MRRLTATLLLLLFSFPLIAPALLAEPASKLPACCRRDGRHHCSMAMEDSETSPAEAEFRSVPNRCPLFPQRGAAPAGGIAFVPRPAAVSYAAIVRRQPAAVRTEARRHLSFSRAFQKRGPPSLFS